MLLAVSFGVLWVGQALMLSGVKGMPFWQLMQGNWVTEEVIPGEPGRTINGPPAPNTGGGVSPPTQPTTPGLINPGGGTTYT